MKACTRCRTVLPAAAFARNATTRDKRAYECKRCARSRKNAWYAANAETVRRKQAIINRQYQASGYFAQYQRAPEKDVAKRAVRNARRTGRITPQPCKVCGAEQVDAHHPDYEKPLEVIWLCRKHHKELHRMEQPEWARAIA